MVREEKNLNMIILNYISISGKMLIIEMQQY